MNSRLMEANINSPKQDSGVEQLGFPVRRVPLDAPWDWLSRGWRDLCTVPSVSVAYGAFFSIAAWIILFSFEFSRGYVVNSRAGGRVHVGRPTVGGGAYETSRRLEKGEPITVREVFDGCAPAIGRLGFFGVVLFFAFFAWVELAFLLLTLFLGGATVPAPSEFVHTLLSTNAGVGLASAPVR